MLAVAVCVQLLAVAPVTALEKCRALDKEFDTKNMPTPCQAAADDATLAIPDRVEALRRLAFAHVLNGDEALAEPAFLRMLAFAPRSELPADAGPKFRELFASAKRRFDSEGALIVRFTPPADPTAGEAVPLVIDVGDKLGRVVGARVTSLVGAVPAEDKLVRNELGAGQLRFTGAVPEPPVAAGAVVDVSYQVVLTGWDDSPIDVVTPIRGHYARGKAVVAAAPEGDFPWLWVGVGSAAGVAVVGAVTGGVIYCYAAGPCRTQDAWVRVQIDQGAQ